MRKDVVGGWGSDLSDGDYACALAALGVLEARGTHQHPATSDLDALAAALRDECAGGERTPLWRGAWGRGGGLDAAGWRETIHRDAASLARAWRQHGAELRHAREQRRLAVPLAWARCGDAVDLDALCGWLLHPEARLDALVLARGPAPAAVPWHWPLRVGVPDGAEYAPLLAALRARAGAVPWVQELSERFTVGAGRDGCDVLLVSPAGAPELARPRVRIRASFVVVAGDPPPLGSAAGEAQLATIDRVGAAGAAWVGQVDDPAVLADWFVELLREVSHDLPIHAAVWRARLDVMRPVRLVVGEPRALDGCRLLAIAARQDRLAASLASPAPVAVAGLVHLAQPAFGGVVGTPDAAAGPPQPTFGGVSSRADALPPPAPPTRPRRMAEALRGRAFVSEDVDGRAVRRELQENEEALDRSRPPRHLQGSAWRPDELAQPARALAAERWNLLALHIGPSLTPSEDAPFPESGLHFAQGDAQLTIQVELAGAAITPLPAYDLWPATVRAAPGAAEFLVRELGGVPAPPDEAAQPPDVGVASCELLLPPSGDSSVALFGVRPQGGVSLVRGRIAVFNKNRILQTASFAGRVGAADDSEPGIEVRAEAGIHPRDDDLEDRREYDVAIQVSDVGGKLHLVVQRGPVPTHVELSSLGSSIGAIRRALERGAVSLDLSKPLLGQPCFDEVLYTLAAHGSSLQQHLRKLCGDEIAGWERIQLVPSTYEFLPLEYLYDGPPPAYGARACPNMLSGLERGGCDRAADSPGGEAPCPNRQEKSTVCPLQFWGLRRVIERHGVSRSPGPAPAPGARAPLACVPARAPFGGANGVLFAAANRAFEYVVSPPAQAKERTALVQALAALSTRVAQAETWGQWRREIATGPNVLVLIAHCCSRHDVPHLEIGARDPLGRQEIGADVGGGSGRPRLLLLLGCSAAGVAEDFQPYPELFRDAGASIVIAPVATIRGADAVPISRHLASLLASRLAASEPTAFGELLPLLRRELLREGHVGVMGLVGFGDGDWLLGGP